MIRVTPPELTDTEAEQYEIIGTKGAHCLAQRPASYVVLQYERSEFKRKRGEKPIGTPVPFNVLDNSLADFSLLVDLLVDKIQYHLPLHRQHQRIQQAASP